MTQQDQARVSVRIMEKEYVIACPYDERSALLDAAEFLNTRMREIRDSGRVVGIDRIAVMAALNLAHEYLNGHWHPMFHLDVAREMEAARLTYVASATLVCGRASRVGVRIRANNRMAATMARKRSAVDIQTPASIEHRETQKDAGR